MTKVGQIERMTQDRVVRLFQDQLEYDYLGNWIDREGNRNIEPEYLRPFLVAQGYPPNGRVRVAAPIGVSEDAVRLAVVTRMGWIRRQKARFCDQPRQSERAYVSGESHYLFGQRFRLDLVEGARAGRVRIRNSRTLELHVRTGSDRLARGSVFLAWYRSELRKRAAPLVESWSKAYGVSVPEFGIKRMRTKWGSCNIEAQRIWLNLELAKKPLQCLEYVIVHELAHFFERNHSDRFVALMDQMMPQWRLVRDELNDEPLAHEEWRN